MHQMRRGKNDDASVIWSVSSKKRRERNDVRRERKNERENERNEINGEKRKGHGINCTLEVDPVAGWCFH